MKKEKIKYFLDNFETYIACIIFIALTILLTSQVITRYIFKHSWAWTEEVATLLFVVFGYCATAGAVTQRKHLRIDILLDAVPFKWKKALLIFSDILFIAFNTYIWFPFVKIINLMKASKAPILGIPKWPFYLAIPIILTLTSIRCIQDIVKLCHEEEKTLGQTKPIIDLAAIEKEMEDNK